MKNSKVIRWGALFCGIALTGLFSCSKTETSSPSAQLSVNALKAASVSTTSEVFDEVMEIGDETLSMYEGLLHGSDSLDKDGGRGHGHHGMGPGDSMHLDSVWHHGDSLRVGDLDHLRDNMGPDNGHLRLGSCTLITREYAGDTLKITISYSADSCNAPDGKVRTGKILVTSIGDYWAGEALVTLSTENYVVDGNQVAGSMVVNSKINADGNRESLIREEGSIMYGDGTGKVTLSSEKTRIATKGTNTTGKQDDVISVTGTGSGTLLSSNTFTSKTLSPLVRDCQKECRGVYLSGITQIDVSDGTVITVDYGDGTCDNLATVTTNGVSETITLEGFLPLRGGGKGHGHGGGK